ncbi:hypothetical protein ACNF77_08990 [Campylobacter coli]
MKRIDLERIKSNFLELKLKLQKTKGKTMKTLEDIKAMSFEEKMESKTVI